MSKTPDSSVTQTVRVAIVQARYRADPRAQFAQTIELISRAAAQGAELVVLGETWLGGYPAWLDHCADVALWDHPPTKAAFAACRRASVTVPGEETRALSRLAADLGVVLMIGVSERVERGPGHGTLYNSLLTIDADGTLLNHHRKLVPTYTERLIWGPGDAHGLRASDTAAGRLGGLICWEHFMPLARQAMHEEAERIHVAVWPTVHDMHQVASRHYAFEGRCFVLAAGQLMHQDELPPGLERATQPAPDGLVLRGGSAIIGPDGRYVTEPVFDREDIILADLDLEAISRESMTLDVTGHYARSDLFHFELQDTTRKEPHT
ncbi:MAG: carbon-nitrogen hydrolase family protein [Acidobacteriota bacterium]